MRAAALGGTACISISKVFGSQPFDASAELALRAERLLGQPVQLCRFEQFVAPVPVDAIWACASLLHVPAPN